MKIAYYFCQQLASTGVTTTHMYMQQLTYIRNSARVYMYTYLYVLGLKSVLWVGVWETVVYVHVWRRTSRKHGIERKSDTSILRTYSLYNPVKNTMYMYVCMYIRMSYSELVTWVGVLGSIYEHQWNWSFVLFVDQSYKCLGVPRVLGA